MKKETSESAFRRALGDVEPEVEHLAAAIPRMISEARRRRGADHPAGILFFLDPVARRAIPRLAAAAAILVVVASLAVLRDTSGAVPGTAAVDRLMLTGETGGETSDILLEAIARTEEDHG